MHNGYAIGIDLGTSNTVAVVRWPDGRTRPLLFDGQPVLPSGVYLDERNQLLIGRDAQRMARLDPSRYEPNPKRRIDDQTILLGDREGPVVGLLAAILQTIAHKAKETCGVLPPATLTYPAAWGSTRRGVLADAATQAGWPSVRMVPEPIAAARYFSDVLRHPVPDGHCLAVFDFGGGTLDIAVVRNNAGVFEVVGSGGAEDLGGLDIDAAIVDHLGQVLGSRHPEIWARLQAPSTPIDRRHHRLFWDDVRGAKEMLSRTSMASVPVPGVDDAIHLTRDELERIADPLIRRAVDCTAEVIESCRLAPGQLAGIFLVGGSSRIPLVSKRLHERFGMPPTVLDQPELPVAEGALVETDVSERLAAPAAAPVSPGPEAQRVTAGAPEPVSPAQPVSPGPGMAQTSGPPHQAHLMAPGVPSPDGPPVPVKSGPTPWYQQPWVYVAAGVVALAVVAGTLFYLFAPGEKPFEPLTSVKSVAIAEDAQPIGTDIEGDRAYLAAQSEGALTLTSVELKSGKTNTVRHDLDADRWESFGAEAFGLVLYSNSGGDRRVHVFDPESLKEIYSRDVEYDMWHLGMGQRMVLVAPSANTLTLINPSERKVLATIPYETDFYPVYNWTDESTAATLSGARFQREYPDNRLVTISDKGTLSVYDLETGAEQPGKSQTVGMIDSTDRAMAYQGTFLVASPLDEGTGFELRKNDLSKPGEPKVIYQANEDIAPERIEQCGAELVCVLTDTGEVVVVNFRSDKMLWKKKVGAPEEIGAIVPVGERILVSTGGEDTATTTVYSAETGEQEHRFTGWAAPVDESSALLFEPSVAEVSSGEVSPTSQVLSLRLVGIGVESGERTELGSADVNPASCSWDSAHIACAAESDFRVFRFRS